MCKGTIVREIIRTKELEAKKEGGAAGTRPRIVYVGDGGGDFCPCVTAMQEGDFILARVDGGGRKYGLLPRIRKHKDKGLPFPPTVLEWSTGHDVLRHFEALFGGNAAKAIDGRSSGSGSSAVSSSNGGDGDAAAIVASSSEEGKDS